MFLKKCIPKIYSKPTGEYPCGSVILIKLQLLYWNRFSVWMFSYKFAAYFQNASIIGTPIRGLFLLFFLWSGYFWKTNSGKKHVKLIFNRHSNNSLLIVFDAVSSIINKVLSSKSSTDAFLSFNISITIWSWLFGFVVYFHSSVFLTHPFWM